jgi:CopG family transcriptional regulator/antitoxin EndoAI
MRETVIWTISLPPQIAQKAMEAAKRENRTRSELVREALRRYMAAMEWERAQAEVSLKDVER